MLKITGYSDKYSAHPGEEIKFYINAEPPSKAVSMCFPRLILGWFTVNWLMIFTISCIYVLVGFLISHLN